MKANTSCDTLHAFRYFDQLLTNSQHVLVTCHRHLGYDWEPHLQGLSKLWLNCSCYNQSPLYAGLHVIASVLRLPLHPAELSNRLFSSHPSLRESEDPLVRNTELWFLKSRRNCLYRNYYVLSPMQKYIKSFTANSTEWGPASSLIRQQLAFS